MTNDDCSREVEKELHLHYLDAVRWIARNATPINDRYDHDEIINYDTVQLVANLFNKDGASVANTVRNIRMMDNDMDGYINDMAEGISDILNCDRYMVWKWLGMCDLDGTETHQSMAESYKAYLNDFKD